jgi:Tfp pilus assembly protein PilN
MIEINLLPRKRKGKKAAAAAAGEGLAFLDTLRGVISSVTNPWLLAACVAWVLVLGGALLGFVTTRARLAVLNSRLEEVRTEKRRFDAVIAQKRQSERMRDSLIAEIDIIKAIDADRYVWPHVLDQLTKALPPYTWLTAIQAVASPPPPAPANPPPAGAKPAMAPPGPVLSVQVQGSTVDIQAYTTFLRQLAASPWLTDITPASSQTVLEQDRPVTAFTVTARYKVADSVYIRTVPFTEAVR